MNPGMVVSPASRRNIYLQPKIYLIVIEN